MRHASAHPKRRATGLAAIAALLAAAAPVAASVAGQDQERTFVQVGSLEVAPQDAEAFLEEVKIVRDAAIEVGLDAAFRWDVYRWDDTFHFVSWHQSLGELDDPTAMAAAFAGTSAADRVTAAMQRAGSLGVVSSAGSIGLSRPDLGYVPANPAVAPGEHGGLYLIEQWPLSDAIPAFEESVKDLMGMLREMGAPYPVFLSQDVLGDGGFTFAVAFDDLASFYGVNSLEAGLASSGMAEQWLERGAAHQRLIRRSESQHVMYLPEHSYRPDLAGGM